MRFLIRFFSIDAKLLFRILIYPRTFPWSHRWKTCRPTHHVRGKDVRSKLAVSLWVRCRCSPPLSMLWVPFVLYPPVTGYPLSSVRVLYVWNLCGQSIPWGCKTIRAHHIRDKGAYRRRYGRDGFPKCDDSLMNCRIYVIDPNHLGRDSVVRRLFRQRMCGIVVLCSYQTYLPHVSWSRLNRVPDNCLPSRNLVCPLVSVLFRTRISHRVIT